MAATDYIFISMLLTSSMLGSIFLITWFTIERKPHALFWSAVFWVSAINMLMNATRELFPDRNIYWVIVNASTLIMLALTLAGYRVRAGLSPFPLPVIGFLLCVEIAITWFTLVDYHMGLRMMFTPYCGAIMGVLCVITLFKKGKTLRAAEWGVVVIYTLYAIAQIGYGTVALMQGPQLDTYWLGIYQQMNLLLMPAVFSGLGLFTVLIIADDLSVRMRHLATTDQLTELLNRRGFFEAADRFLENCRRHDELAFLALTDIDHFKKINDRYGHAAGDMALRRFSALLNHELRRNDLRARVGGEEFAILFTASNLSEAKQILVRLKSAIELMPITGKFWQFSMTASFGLVSMCPSRDNIFQALIRADGLLYRAKANGRNCVVSDHEASPSPIPA
ncbi:GGDEF domain-containing protein [uncultured Microbulbifer sp.]|uniref:GGDEF domain-containing protein n=1 Tax=uncultured Microbulbifer sp. TaxID=348147 RepID=UPI002607C39B|nr:GGDEF domain-containing protein [uncultured Microbulbifer sp.]